MNGLKPYLLAMIVPLMAIITMLSFYFYQKDSIQLAEHVKANEISHLESLVTLTHLHLDTVNKDLSSLIYRLQQDPIHEPLRVLEKARILKQFKSLLINSELYTSVRLIDYKNSQVLLLQKENDKIVIDYNEKITNTEELQRIDHAFSLKDKINYIQKNKGSLSFYQHLKAQHSDWVIQLNYKTIPLTTKSTKQPRANMIINRHGEWLSAPYYGKSLIKKQDNPAINMEEKTSFKAAYPYLWNTMDRLNHDKGQTIIGDYLYTYSPIIFNSQNVNKKVSKASSEWILISAINIKKELNALYFSNFTRIRLTSLIIAALCLFVGSGLLIWRLVKNHQQAQQLRQQRDDTLKRYASVIQNSEDGIIVLNNKRVITAINNAAYGILNLSPAAVNKPFIPLFYSDHNQNELIKLLNLIDLHPSNKQLKTHIKLKYKRSKYLEIIATKKSKNIEDNILLNISDVSYWVEREKKLQALSRAADQSAESVVITNKTGFIQYVNSAYVEQSGHTAEALIGSHSAACFKHYIHNEDERAQLIQKLMLGESIQHVVTRQHNDQITYVDYTISPIRGDDGQICNYIATSKDITDRISYENRLHRLAHYDTLTQLPNRSLFTQYIDQSLKQAKQYDTQVAIMMIDLDLNKPLQEALTNEEMERIIVILAKRVKSNLRSADTLARIETNKLGILIKSFHDIDILTHLAERLLKNMCAPLSIDNRVISIVTNIGIAISNSTENDAEMLQKYAHIALFRAQALAASQYCYFTDSMEEENVKRLLLESDLRKSVGTPQYEYFFQPKVCAKSHQLCGVEALLRWKDEYGTYHSPMHVIPILENSELIINAGKYLIEQACLQLKQWQDKQSFFDLAINISARQLLESDLVQTVTEAINTSGCNPHYLELELTESVLMCDVNFALTQLHALKALGIKIAIDDFGTGYSSLAYLSRFPINILKVDREFIKELPFNKDSITICRSIIELAHNLGLTVVAEGVENHDQLVFLESLGVEELQGFLFDRPLPISDFEAKFITKQTSQSLTL